MQSNAKILLIDIETAPAKVYTWGLWDQNIGINQVVEDGYVLCWCAKWFGSKTIMSDAIINYPKQFAENPTNDKLIAQSAWKLLDEADIVVTHNGDSFDLKWLNTLFMKHHLPPVSTYKSVDTCKEAKRNFNFLSNKLDFISRKLDLGHKLDTGGFELWEKCMKGDKTAWKKMIIYCKHDVLLLEKAYKSLRPFIKAHPNLGLYRTDSQSACSNCGGTSLIKKGYAYTFTGKYQRYVCADCGKNMRDRKALLETNKGPLSA